MPEKVKCGRCGLEYESEPVVEKDGCRSCDDHCARCFDDPLGKSMPKWPTDSPTFESDLNKYFKRVEVQDGQSFQAGWYIVWRQNKHHSGIATGSNRTISQYGFSIEHWKLRRKHEKNPKDMTESEKQLFHSTERFEHNEANADELSEASQLGSYDVYDLKDEYKNLRNCKHLKQVTLDLRWKDYEKIPYPRGELATYYGLNFELWLVVPENKQLSKFDGWVRIPGGHTHYGCEGWKTITLQLDAFEKLSEDELVAWAKSQCGFQFASEPIA